MGNFTFWLSLSQKVKSPTAANLISAWVSSAPDRAGGAHSAYARPLMWILEVLLLREKGEMKRDKKVDKERKREGTGREPQFTFLATPLESKLLTAAASATRLSSAVSPTDSKYALMTACSSLASICPLLSASNALNTSRNACLLSHMITSSQLPHRLHPGSVM